MPAPGGILFIGSSSIRMWNDLERRFPEAPIIKRGLNEKAACRAVVVAAINARARAWWERLGFHPFDPDESAGGDLYLLTSEIDATMSSTADV